MTKGRRDQATASLTWCARHADSRGKQTFHPISGHSSTRMLERYTHPTLERLIAALDTFDLFTTCPQNSDEDAVQQKRGSRSRLFPQEVWWTAGGSNSRPPRCERGALPTELAAHSSELRV